MKAAVIYEHGPISNIRLEADYPTPEPGPGWVLLRVRACSINHHDLFTRRGMPGIKIPMPIVIGSDVAGEVAAVGDGVTEWSVGDRVLVDPMPTVESNFKFLGENVDGGRAEYCLAHAKKLLRIPDNVGFEVAGSIPLAYATAHRMMTTIGQVRAGERVAVLGASGGVGTACVLIAKMLGAEVVACAGSDEKLERLKALGADHLVNYNRDSLREGIWKAVGRPRAIGTPEGVDVVINSTGGDTWVDSLRCLRRNGRLLTCGATAGFDERVDVRYIWTFEMQVRGSNGWTRSDIESLLDLASQGRLTPVIDRVLPLADVHEAERLVEAREVFGKVVLVP